MGENLHRIFLLEFLVDKIQFKNIFLEENDQTCVRFKFLNYPVLDVCEEDFAPKAGSRRQEVEFKSGKSVLFSVGGPKAASFELPFDVSVTAARAKRGEGGGGQPLGSAVVRLGGSFTDLVNQPQPGGSKSLKGDFPLRDAAGNEIGHITLFLRLSCFGGSIVTQFHLGGNQNRSFLFKPGEGASAGQLGQPSTSWNPAGAAVESRHGGEQYWAGQVDPKAFNVAPGGPPMGLAGDRYQQEPGVWGAGGFGWGGGGAGQGYAGDGGWGGGGHPCLCGPCDPDYSPPSDKSYKELSVEVKGTSMNIKVIRKPRRPKSGGCQGYEAADEYGGYDEDQLTLEGPFCPAAMAPCQMACQRLPMVYQ